MKKITPFVLLAFSGLSAQIINTAPYILTVDEAKVWTSTGPTASTDLISTVPLATRFTDQQTQFNPALTNDMQIAYLPDGMNNFGNYHGEQTQFNLFNFTHWQYIDKLVWFGGTASQTVQLPSSPWVNAAHRSGVKVFGDIFFSPTAFGGSSATLQNFLEQDTDGQFLVIPRLVEMANYYHFDGWFINQETATTAAIAGLMQDFVRDFTAASEASGKEVMWYDAMVLSGGVGWQNRLNSQNSPFVQDDADGDGSFEQRVSSNIFINFFWSTATLPAASRTRAQLIGRSQFDVFTGADIWPGRNQGDFEINGNTFMTRLHENATTPYTSLGLFAPNCVYNNSTYTNFNNDPADYATFYNAENHMFSGDDNNPAVSDASGFKGFCNWVPEAGIAATSLQTYFCTGHGRKKFELGNATSIADWHDMNLQDILPTWQWAFSQNGILTARWDFDDALNGGNSIKISGNLPANTPIDLMLYKTRINTSGGCPAVSVFHKNITADNSSIKLILVFSDEPGQKYAYAFPGGIDFSGWIWEEIAASDHCGREIAMIGLRFESPVAISGYEMNIGGLTADNLLLNTKNHDANNSFVTAVYPDNARAPLFKINWPNAFNLKFSVLATSGLLVNSGVIAVKNSPTFKMPVTLSAGTYIVKFTDESNRSETVKVMVR